jgi:hypothetical protein
VIVDLRCKQCTKRFRIEHRTRGRFPRFCSTECRLANRRSRRKATKPYAKQIVCLTCGEPCTVRDSRVRTCSVVCGQRLAAKLSREATAALRKRQREETAAKRGRACEGCGRPFEMRKPSGKARRGEVREGRFCSRSCRDAWQRGRQPQPDLFDR